MAFPDYSSAFGNISNSVGVAFNPSTGNLAGASGGFSMGPFAAALGIANIGASLFGGIQGAGAQRAASQDQLKAAKFAAKKQLEAAELNVARDLLGMQFNEAVVAPAELARQKDALRFDVGEMGALRRAGSSEDFRRAMEQQTSGPYKEAMRFANREQLKNSLAKQIGAGRATFGPIAPISVDTMFVG